MERRIGLYGMSGMGSSMAALLLANMNMSLVDDINSDKVIEIRSRPLILETSESYRIGYNVPYEKFGERMPYTFEQIRRRKVRNRMRKLSVRTNRK